MNRLGILLFILFFCGHTVLAQSDSDSFFMRVLVGEDVEPPTTPTLISATAMAPTQVDLVWSPAVDNYLVGGYVVLRDAVAIATTTQISYSDTSLVASTTYTYAVIAFDSSLNYSSTSNSLIVTTSDFPPPPTSGEPDNNSTSIQGTSARVVVKDFYLEAKQISADFKLESAMPSRIEVRWGRSDAYELGYLVSNVYVREHAFSLIDLEPGTDYEYEIIGYTPIGTMTKLRSGKFTTLSEMATKNPANVQNFIAEVEGNDVRLRWKLPDDEDVLQVRIVRSHLDFPTYPQEGAIVYQGLSEEFRDKSILLSYSPVFYTAFVYDKYGNVSSGAISLAYASNRQGGEADTSGNPKTTIPVQTTSSLPLLEIPQIVSEATSSLPSNRLPPETKMPSLSDIKLIQGYQIRTLLDADIKLSYNEDYTIQIPADLVSKHLKTIIVSVLDPTDHKKVYSFLLKLDRQNKNYEAIIPASGVEGMTQIKVSVYDFESFVVATYQAPMRLLEPVVESDSEVFFPDKFLKGPVWILPVLLVIALSLFWFLLRLRVEDNR
jgi:hypothetical protein